MYYARQIPPDVQESPIWKTDEYDKIFVKGAKKCDDHNENSPVGQMYKKAHKYIKDAIWEIKERKVAKMGFKIGAINEIVTQTIHKMDGSALTNKELGKLTLPFEKIFECGPGYDPSKSEQTCARVMSIIDPKHDYSGVLYDNPRVRNDTLVLFYDDKDYTHDDILRFRAQYFNLGTQWMVSDFELNEVPNDITSIATGATKIKEHSVYCCSTDLIDTRKEIADALGTTSDNIVLFKFERYNKIPVHTKI